MELTTLRYFRTIVQAGHMTRAAAQLGVSQPALSASIKKLEAEVGLPLLHRTRRGVSPTDAGRVFLEHAESSLRSAAAGVDAVRQLAGLESGSIRVGGGATAISYVLPPVIRTLRKSHPGLKFYIREAGSSAVAAAVVSGELDLGIVTLPIRGDDDAKLVLAATFDDELRLIVPPGHRLAGRKSFAWKDLAGEAFVGFEAGSAVREVIDSAARAAGVTLDTVMELRSIGSIKSMVLAGVGVAFVSKFVLGPRDELGPGLACRDGPVGRRLALVRRSGRVPTPAAAAFERAIKARRAPVGEQRPDGDHRSK